MQRESMKVIRSQRRTLSLELHPEHGLLIRAPLRMPQQEIEAFVATRKQWIEGHEARLAEARAARGPRNYLEGEVFGYLGEDLVLCHHSGQWPSRRPKTRREGGRLVIDLNRAEGLSGDRRRDDLKESVVAFYRNQAKLEFAPRVAFYCDELGLRYPSVTIAHQRRRWGSCSSRSGLRLNLRLLLCDDDLVDYVVAHEVCHLKEMNHGPHFHRLLESLIPGARARSQRLAQESERYRF